MKALCVAPIAAGAVLLCGVLLSVGASAGTPGSAPPGAPRTLDLTIVPMSITQPGTYVVRRNWDLTASNPNGSGPGITAITVLASDVVIDFAGYQIKFADYGTGVKVKADNVTLRNGVLGGGTFSATIRSSGADTVVEHLSIYTYEGLQLLGPGAVVRDSDINGKGDPLHVGDGAVIERNTITSPSGVVVLANNDRLERNRLWAHSDVVVTVHGDRNVLIDNVVDGDNGEYSWVFNVTGNRNVLLRNTVLVPLSFGTVFYVDGTANILDANVAAPRSTEMRTGTGIRFQQAGNFYGNNRMSAQTPYDLGGATQTSWGGNVAY